MIGQVIGTYRIEQEIGAGGMGAVYKGRDLMLEREVAIKALRPELARQPELVARFRSEAVTLARLNHSHIATLYNFLRHGDDFYMVMEFVPGRTLEAVLRQEGAMELVRAVRLFCEALAGIAHAHALGIVHRDIKPANLMLNRTDEVKVMDFGIARVLGTARQTQTGRLIGTLEYMSPEQMRGQETDARADIYSLGILLYEMLTGRVPFESRSDYELMRAQVESEPPPPREINADIPIPVELAILRALAKDPAARFQDADEFRAALLNAVPEAAIKTTPSQMLVAEPAIKATRAAVGFAESDNLDWQRFNVAQSESAAQPRPSGFDRSSGTFTLKLPAFVWQARQRIGPLNWKHYSVAASALLVAVIGLTWSNTAPRQPNPSPRVCCATPPVVEKTMTPIEPLPSLTPVTIPGIITANGTTSDNRTTTSTTPRLTSDLPPMMPRSSTAELLRRQNRVFTQPTPTPTPAPSPKPSPTPTPNKWNKAMDGMNKTADAAGKVWGLFKKKKNRNE